MKPTEKDHWEKIYACKEQDEVSWFQPYSKTSMEFVELFNLPLTANIIDIGGGDSHSVDALTKVIKTFGYLIFQQGQLKEQNKG